MGAGEYYLEELEETLCSLEIRRKLLIARQYRKKVQELGGSLVNREGMGIDDVDDEDVLEDDDDDEYEDYEDEEVLYIGGHGGGHGGGGGGGNYPKMVSDLCLL